MSRTEQRVRLSFKVNVDVYIAEEEEQWVAYCPMLEVSSYGDSEEEAREMFEEAVEIFIEETARRGTLERELLRMGWTLASTDYRPPSLSYDVERSLRRRKRVSRTISIPSVHARIGVHAAG